MSTREQIGKVTDTAPNDNSLALKKEIESSERLVVLKKVGLIFFPIACSILASQLPTFLDMMIISRISLAGTAAFGLGVQIMLTFSLFTSGSNTILQLYSAKEGKESAFSYHNVYTFRVVTPAAAVLLGMLLFVGMTNTNDEIRKTLFLISLPLTVNYWLSMTNLNLSGLLIGLEKNKLVFLSSLLSTSLHILTVLLIYWLHALEPYQKILLISCTAILTESIAILIRIKGLQPIPKYRKVKEFKDFFFRSVTKNVASGLTVSAIMIAMVIFAKQGQLAGGLSSIMINYSDFLYIPSTALAIAFMQLGASEKNRKNLLRLFNLTLGLQLFLAFLFAAMIIFYPTLIEALYGQSIQSLRKLTSIWGVSLYFLGYVLFFQSCFGLITLDRKIETVLYSGVIPFMVCSGTLLVFTRLNLGDNWNLIWLIFGVCFFFTQLLACFSVYRVLGKLIKEAGTHNEKKSEF